MFQTRLLKIRSDRIPNIRSALKTNLPLSNPCKVKLSHEFHLFFNGRCILQPDLIEVAILIRSITAIIQTDIFKELWRHTMIRQIAQRFLHTTGKGTHCAVRGCTPHSGIERDTIDDLGLIHDIQCICNPFSDKIQ